EPPDTSSPRANSPHARRRNPRSNMRSLQEKLRGPEPPRAPLQGAASAMSRAPGPDGRVVVCRPMSQAPSARDVPGGGYRFLPGIAPFSSGAAAAPGHQVVHATLRAAVPWRAGFELIERHLRAEGRPRAAPCAIELRSPARFSSSGFDGFNAGYQALLAEGKLLVGGENPIARTNVAPVVGAPAEPSLYGFGYTVAGATERPTFIVAGAGEMRERGVGVEGIVRHRGTSPPPMRAKAAPAMRLLQGRLPGLRVPPGPAA